MSKENKCLVCRGVEKKTVFKKDRYLIVKCLKCGFGRLIGKSTFSYDRKYFRQRQLESFRGDSFNKFLFVDKFLKKGSKVLDFGCGLGDFLSLAQKEGFDVFGYDPSVYARDYVLKKYKIKIITAKLKEDLFEEKFFDCIVTFDVIEHIENFFDVVSLFARWLKKGGLVFITTPNIKGWDAKLLGGSWYGFKKIPEHVNYFSPVSIEKVLKESGFSDVRVLGWGFKRNLNFLLKVLGISKAPKFLKNFSIFIPGIDMMIMAKSV